MVVRAEPGREQSDQIADALEEGAKVQHTSQPPQPPDMPRIIGKRHLLTGGLPPEIGTANPVHAFVWQLSSWLLEA